MYFMERISEHITHKEAVRSNTALRLNLKNIPDDYQVSNMVGIATHVFEPLREYVGGPIKINSMFIPIQYLPDNAAEFFFFGFFY